MKIKMRAVALATATALVGAGIAVPTAPTATAQSTTNKAPVGGLTWPDAETGFGGEVQIAPQGTPKGDYRFSVQKELGGFTFSVDASGVVTVKAPVDSTGKSSFNTVWTHVEVHSRNGAYIGSHPVTVTAKRELTKPKAVWAPVTMRGNQTVTAPQTASLPAGTKFRILHEENPKLSETVEVTVNTKGDVTARPKVPRLRGRFTVAVEVTFPNGHKQIETLYFPISEQSTPKPTDPKPSNPTNPTPAGGSSTDGSSGAGILLGVLALLGAAGAAIFAFMQNNGGFRLPF